MFRNCSPTEFKEVKNCINMVAGRTNKQTNKQKTKKMAILIATLHKKNYFAHEYLLNGELVGINYLRFFISFSLSITLTLYVLVFFLQNVNMIFICFYNFNINKKNNSKSIKHVVNFLKLVLRVLTTVLKNQKN